MIKLHSIADRESGWLAVVASMVEVIPMQDPLGPANITLLLDECPLPSGDTIQALVEMVLDLGPSSGKQQQNPNRHQNVAVVLGCLAEKLAGARSIALFCPRVLRYLVGNLVRKTAILRPILFFFFLLYSYHHHHCYCYF